ncbi:uncharacterized protein LOC131679283 [Topomyia yanbarensis]|uniref:uncharacterized protein LOC131679283 n=1 Tax=Topomyia yanbarensis TaxID=2498891 RepID=UPI00273C1EAD|nr:uncharacterized protein LOC131679283 [Topomyia yanbarensis]
MFRMRSSSIFCVIFCSWLVSGTDECGQRVVLTRELVHFGNQSRSGEWPWHVALFHRMNRASPSYACGGTILSKNYVVTAAHCTYPQSRVRPLKAAEVLVRAGIANIQQLEHSLQQMAVVEILRHEEYNTNSLECDIALLKLAGDFEFTNYVRKICCWTGSDEEEQIVGKNGIIVGWGRDETETLPDVLKHASVPIVSRKSCRDSDPNYYTRYLFDRKTFCAGHRNGTSSGLGDSGGGLYIEIDGKWRLRGIVSNGKVNPVTRLLDVKSYVVYTDVAYFLPWLNNKMNLTKGSEDVTTSVQDFAVCGKKKDPQFLRTGYKEERKWPWKGDVYKQSKKPLWLCEVAIVSEYFLLSPAEVYSDSDVYNPYKLYIIFQIFRNGKHQLLSYLQIHQIIRHENFDSHTRMNNIALLQLKSPMKFTEFLRPICLWKGDPARGIMPSTIGYLGEFQDWIKHHDKCVEEIQKISNSTLNEHSLCITISTYQFHGFLGDLLYLKVGESWYLGGISFNMIRYESIFHILLLDVAYYKDWIERNSVLRFQNLLALENCYRTSVDQWMYQIYNRYVFQCYASLITTSLLLTTASCVDEIPVKSVYVLNDHHERVSTVSKLHLHPSFDKLEFTNNIAIVELEQAVDKIPICLSKTPEKLSSLTQQSLSWQPNPSKTNSILHSAVNFTSTNIRTCANRWQQEGAKVDTTGSNICGLMIWQELQKSLFQCTFNLHGSPLVSKSNNNTTMFLKGVLDIGKSNHCVANDLPEVYIDVMAYSEWITEIGLVNRGSFSVPVGIHGSPSRQEWRLGIKTGN